MALEITTSVKIIRRFWMRLRTIPPIPFLIWGVGPAETFTIFVYWGTAADSDDCGHLFRLKADSDSDRSRTAFR